MNYNNLNDSEKEQLKEESKEFMKDFEESCRLEKEELFEDDYFETFKDNQGIITYDEENEGIERMGYKDEDLGKALCLAIVVVPIAFISILLAIWQIRTYGLTSKNVIEFVFFIFIFISPIYHLINVFKNRKK